MKWINENIFWRIPVDFGELLFLLITFSASVVLVMLIWCGLRRIVKDRRHTGLVYHSLKVVLMFQLIPLTDILFRIAGIMDIQWNNFRYDTMLPSPLQISAGRILVSIWAIGFVVHLFLRLREGVRFKRLTRSCMPVCRKTTELFDSYRRELGIRKKIKLAKSNAISTPLIYGVFRPVVIIPEELEARPEQLRYVFLHELLHYRHRDPLFKQLTVLSGCIHWFNPMVRVLMPQYVNTWTEYYCDESVCAVTESGKAYCSTLLEVACDSGRRYRFGSALVEEKPLLLRRIERMAKRPMGKKTKRWAVGLLLIAFLLGNAVTVLGAGYGVSRLHRGVAKETRIETKVPYREPEQLTEHTEWLGSDADIEEGEVTESRSAIVHFEWTVAGGAMKKTPSFYKSTSETIRVDAEIDPNNISIDIGYIDPEGYITFVSGQDSIYHTFTLYKTGSYKVFVRNNSSTSVMVSGMYRK